MGITDDGYDTNTLRYDYNTLDSCNDYMEEVLQMNYCTTKGLIWPVLFCVFVIIILPVLLVDNKKYCKQSIVPCYPWNNGGLNE